MSVAWGSVCVSAWVKTATTTEPPSNHAHHTGTRAGLAVFHQSAEGARARSARCVCSSRSRAYRGSTPSALGMAASGKGAGHRLDFLMMWTERGGGGCVGGLEQIRRSRRLRTWVLRWYAHRRNPHRRRRRQDGLLMCGVCACVCPGRLGPIRHDRSDQQRDHPPRGLPAVQAPADTAGQQQPHLLHFAADRPAAARTA